MLNRILVVMKPIRAKPNHSIPLPHINVNTTDTGNKTAPLLLFFGYAVCQKIDIGLEYMFQRTYLNSASVRDQTWFLLRFSYKFYIVEILFSVQK